MADNQSLIVAVLVKYALKQPLTEPETRLLREWQARSGEHQALPDQLRDPQWREEHRREIQEAPSDAMWENIRRHILQNPDKKRQLFLRRQRRRIAWRSAAAAAVIGVILLLGKPAWRWMKGDNLTVQSKNGASLVAVTNPPDNDDYGVRITLSDGRAVFLDDARQGATFSENGLIMTRTDSGIAYTNVQEQAKPPQDRKDSPGPSKGMAVIANQLIKGAMQILTMGKRMTQPFRVDLPDGSKIWVNLKTTLFYPIDLHAGLAPKVEGEAWFDVAKDQLHRPVRIRTPKEEQEVTLMGTSVAIRSYPGEEQTTVEVYSGKVRVKNKKDSVVVHPGSVAVMTEGKRTDVKKMGARQSMPAWMLPLTNLYFVFRNTPLTDALKEVASWYSLNLSNPYNVKGIPITGNLPRNQSPENTLRALQQVQSGQAFLHRKGDTIIILPGDAGP